MLTAVVLYYKNWPAIVTTVQRLLVELPTGAGVVVVDNCSDDGAVPKLRLQFPTVAFVVCQTNGGYAAGMNEGLRVARKAGSTLALLMTHECLLEPGAVAALTREMEQDDTIGLVGPVLSTQETPARVFSSGGMLKGRTLVPEHVPQDVNGAQDSGRANWDVDWVDGACMLVRLSAVENVGPLDETFFLYVEEVEFALRLRRGGYRVVCVGGAGASQSTNGIPPYYETRNQLRLTRLHGQRGALALATARHAWCAAQDLRHGRTTDAARRASGLIDFYRGRTGRQ